MDNDKFQELMLQQLEVLAEGQKSLQEDVLRLEIRFEHFLSYSPGPPESRGNED